MKRALITGIGGQDASYLAEFLLDKCYKVFGTYRRVDNLENIEHVKDRITLLEADLNDEESLVNAVQESNPDEVYNLGGLSYVSLSWGEPVLVGDITGLGVARLLKAIRAYNPAIKYYQASSSEMIGNSFTRRGGFKIQDELTPFHPRSPYACAKAYAHYLTINYRESYGMFCCNGICFNHESPRRGLQFVTRKITDGVAKIKLGLANDIHLGNLDAHRDWGFAGDYVEAMWLMLQQDKPDDYVIATGETHTIRDFLDEAFNCVGIKDWSKYVVQDPKFMRPADVDYLLGDASKARKELGWKVKTDFKQLVKIMMDAELKELKNGKIV